MEPEVNIEAAAAEAAAAEAAKEAERQRKAEEKAAKDAEKERKRQEREAAKAAKESEKAEKEAAKAARVRQNGVLQPLAGSKCGQAWALFDEISRAKGEPATIAEALPHAEERGLNPGNIRAEYGQWRKFYGVPVQPRAAKVKAEPAAADAPASE